MNKLVSAATLSTLLILAGCSDGADNGSSAESGDAGQTAQSERQTDAGSSQQGDNGQQGDNAEQQADSFESEQARLAYAVGVTLARNLQTDMEDLDVDAFTGAIRDVYDGDDSVRLNDQEIGEVLQNYQQQMVAEQQQAQEEQARENATAGENFLEENAARDGVETTDSGLQYRVEEPGDQSAAQPGASDRVRVHYEGRTVDGEVFDSSMERGEPVDFRVDQVIPGWQQALEMMHPGATWEIFIPAELAYGEAGTGPIGPNQTLIFTVELLEVNPEADSAQDEGQMQGEGQMQEEGQMQDEGQMQGAASSAG